MKFLKPKNKNSEPVGWKISEQTRYIVKYYAEYLEFTEDEVVDEFLKNIIDDKDFIEWVESKRFNKRILSQIQNVKEESIG
ncbi:hypothetical protein [Bacillus pseudomycoides]|uniref:hypothetical protein n=1 Tax=Bacillus pseudomycoides TaxID=64104 RepID=UPI001FB373AA|nr:hypothetical protein [Bacillus pseudomycoides]